MVTTHSQHRKTIRLKEYDYSMPGGYFITICTYDKQWLFGTIVDGEMQFSPQGLIAQRCWNDIAKHFYNIELDAFVVMPNHIHGIIILDEITVGVEYIQPLQKTFQHVIPNSIPSIIRSYKAAVSRECHKRNLDFCWQRNHYEHIIRNDKQLNTIRRYILGNPAQWETDDEYAKPQ
jgi:putative transposase